MGQDELPESRVFKEPYVASGISISHLVSQTAHKTRSKSRLRYQCLLDNTFNDEVVASAASDISLDSKTN